MNSIVTLRNVKDDIRAAVSADHIAAELAKAVDGLFTITFHRRFKEFEALYTSVYCKPTRNIGESLLLEREVLALVANFTDLQPRAFQIARRILEESNQRLDPSLLVVVHADRRGDERLRQWAHEAGIKVIPIYRPKAGAIPPKEILRRNLARELFAHDPFQVTGVVVSEADFFGRGNETLDLLRQLQAGRIRALFGIRKIGKTSLINRVITLARAAGNPRLAMVDCSVGAFNGLRAESALRALAKVCKLAATQGYAHITEALKRSDEELIPVFDDLWSKGGAPALAIVFDEVDYITPDSPTALHWRSDFLPFWREFRALVQEAQRHGLRIAVLVCGVSSKWFRRESIDGVENPVLFFVPEEYLAPFARPASIAMLRDLARRAGLEFDGAALSAIARFCCDLPFWMRMAGSHINRAIDVEGRPVSVSAKTVEALLQDFVATDGANIAEVAVEDLVRKDPEILALMRRASGAGRMPSAEGRLLQRYALASATGHTVTITGQMILAGLERIREVPVPTVPAAGSPPAEPASLALADGEWAEELSVINRRRVLLERRMREFVRVVLKLGLEKGRHWVDEVLKSLPEATRSTAFGLGGDAIMDKIYWQDLERIVCRHWPLFEKTVGDKRRFQLAMGLLNDRPDAHAKPVDAADLALYRRELTWLEEQLA